jgi:hypothetical protein
MHASRPLAPPQHPTVDGKRLPSGQIPVIPLHISKVLRQLAMPLNLALVLVTLGSMLVGLQRLRLGFGLLALGIGRDHVLLKGRSATTRGNAP